MLASTTRCVKKPGEVSLDVSEMRPVNVVTSLMCHLNDLSVTGVIYVTKFNRTMLRCVKFKRTMLSNVFTAKAISGALLSSYLTQCIKNTNSVATTPLQFRNEMYNFVAELSHLLCNVFADYTFWHKKYEFRLTIDIGLLHIYHISVLPPKQHKIPLIVSP